MIELIIANKMYSSWSLRPWIVMKHFNVPFTEKLITLGNSDTRSNILLHSPSRFLPVLKDEDLIVWDSLAIIEYIGDVYNPEIWPKSHKTRATARSLAAEMHSGFHSLRSVCPMNLGKKYPFKSYDTKVLEDVERITSIIQHCREQSQHDGHFLFGSFTAVDAIYLPLIIRLDTYSFPLSSVLEDYREKLFSLPAYQEWRNAALDEPWVVNEEEVADKPIHIFRHR